MAARVRFRARVPAAFTSMSGPSRGESSRTCHEFILRSPRFPAILQIFRAAVSGCRSSERENESRIFGGIGSPATATSTGSAAVSLRHNASGRRADIRLRNFRHRRHAVQKNVSHEIAFNGVFDLREYCRISITRRG